MLMISIADGEWWWWLVPVCYHGRVSVNDGVDDVDDVDGNEMLIRFWFDCDWVLSLAVVDSIDRWARHEL